VLLLDRLRREVGILNAHVDVDVLGVLDPLISFFHVDLEILLLVLRLLLLCLLLDFWRELYEDCYI